MFTVPPLAAKSQNRAKPIFGRPTSVWFPNQGEPASRFNKLGPTLVPENQEKRDSEAKSSLPVRLSPSPRGRDVLPGPYWRVGTRGQIDSG